jgi:hypothetical protein
MAEFTLADLEIKVLGERTIDSPLDAYYREVGKTRLLRRRLARPFDHNLTHSKTFHNGEEPPCFEAAGLARRFF